MALVLTPHPLAPRGAARLLSLFDAMEATAACRLPPATVEVPAGLTVQFWRTQAAPRELPEEGCLIGMSVHRGMSQAVRIGRDDRRRHVYLMGQTGTGKTTLLQTMILDDMRAGAGLCVIDPHGDLFRELLGQVPAERIEDVVILDPTDIEHPVGLNMLEYNTEAQRHFLIQELVGIIFRLMQDEYGEQAATMTGPIFFQHMRMNLLLAMSNPANPGTLLEFYTIYQEKDYWRRWLPLKTADPLLERWVKESLPSLDYTKPASEGTSMGGYIGSKFEGFVFDPMLRNIFGQKRSTLNLREIMDTGKVLLVNLAKGELTETNSRFLGMMLLAKLQAAAMGRVKLPRHERRDFSLYVDEFQSLATQHFVTLLSEARKFGLNLVLANQFVSQIKDPRIVQALFGNVGTLIAFRLGQMDAELVERELSPVFTRFDLVNLPNWRAYMTTLINGQTVQPFSLQTLFDPTPIDAQRAATVQKRSRQAYGRLRRQAEAEIAKSFQGDTKS
ncbi:MAG: type IV secretory system conjugative DNA transfer family protein, partial [Candidatus Binatia bacterium]